MKIVTRHCLELCSLISGEITYLNVEGVDYLVCKTVEIKNCLIGASGYDLFELRIELKVQYSRKIVGTDCREDRADLDRRCRSGCS